MYTYTPRPKVLRLDHAVAPSVDGTKLAVPGFTMLPEKFAPFSCSVWKRFEYDVIDRPFDRVGNGAVPPGMVSVNVWPGVTESGAMTSIVMSWIWWSVVVPTTAVQSTPVNVCVTSCAPELLAVDATS